MSMPEPDYWEGLLEKIKVEESNAVVSQQIADRLGEVLYQYPDALKLLADMDISRFAHQAAVGAKCEYSFPGTKRLIYYEQAIIGAKAFGRAIAKAWAENERSNAQQKAAYDHALARAKAELPRSAFESLVGEVNRLGALSNVQRSVEHEDPTLGSLPYTLRTVQFDENAFNSARTEINRTLYADNSLSTGSKPWAYCYGGQNSCDGYGCSEIVVLSGGSDVLVTIKNASDRVVRHAYIRRLSRYSFELPNGSYQPFFYYGKGWDPNKEMKRVACGMLKGGFISGEHVGKDDLQFLSGSILTYTLVEQVSGNFSTRPSSTNEAL